MKTISLLFLSLVAGAPLLAGSLSVNSKNGQATVKWNGREVWSGEASGNIKALSKSDNGKEYAAALDGGKVLWESEPGAAEKVQADAKLPGAMPELPPVGRDASGGGVDSKAGISTSTVNGETVIRLDGKEVWKGATSGKVTAKVVNENGVRHAAAFDGDRLLWENVKGAGAKVRPKSVSL